MKWHRGTLGYEAIDSRNRIWLVCNLHKMWKGKCIIGKHSQSDCFPVCEKKLEDAKRKLNEMAEHE